MSGMLPRFALWLSLAVMPILLLPAISAAQADSGMQKSLAAFFAQGVTLRGASAKLVKVQHWPDTKGRVHWALPASLHGHPGRISVIATQGKRRWYVPVQVRWMATAIVMRKQVPARSLLTQAMMTKKQTNIANHSGSWWQDAADLVGQRLTRPLAAGDVILTSYVKRPPMIKRGDIVSIILDMGGIHIRTQGKALRTAARGERLQVRNLRSKEIIQAVAESAGMVRVAFRGRRG
ncbi:MAG: flagellar basal body P-ring formation chaperone FlgA [Mariprofundus sp.]